MTILIVHKPTGTILDASDDVDIVNTDDLSNDEILALENGNMDIADEYGEDILPIIRIHQYVSVITTES